MAALTASQKDALLGLAEQADLRIRPSSSREAERYEITKATSAYHVEILGTWRRPKTILRTGQEPSLRTYSTETRDVLFELGLIEEGAASGSFFGLGMLGGYRLTATGWRVVSRIRAEEDTEPQRNSRDWLLMRETLRSLFMEEEG